MCHCVKFHPIFYHLTMCFFVFKVKQTQGISLTRYKTIVGFTLTIQLSRIFLMFLEPTLSVKGQNVPTSSLLEVIMETFAVQRSQSALPSMVYTTLEDCTLEQQEMEAMCTMCTCSGSNILINRQINILKHPCLGQRPSLSPTVISLSKSAFLSHSIEIQMLVVVFVVVFCATACKK